MSVHDGPPAEPEPGGESMTVEVDGTSRQLPVEHDYTGDGRPDAAVETAAGTVIVFADTEDNETGAAGPDGRADQAYVIDKRTGQVVSTAHLDPASGTWVDLDGRPVGVPIARPRSMTTPTGGDKSTGRAVDEAAVEPGSGDRADGSSGPGGGSR